MKNNSTLLACLLLTGVATSALAQQTTFKNETAFGLSRVLAYNGVPTDLGLDETQTDQLRGLWSQVDFKLRYKFRDYRNNFSSRMGPAEKNDLEQQLLADVNEVREYEMERLEEVLSAKQISRLKQIRYQLIDRQGGALPQLKDELSLTAAQLSQLKGIKKDLLGEIAKLRKESRSEQLSQNEIAEQLKLIKLDFEEKFGDILTATQLQKLNSIKGSTFEFQVGKR